MAKAKGSKSKNMTREVSESSETGDASDRNIKQNLVREQEIDADVASRSMDGEKVISEDEVNEAFQQDQGGNSDLNK